MIKIIKIGGPAGMVPGPGSDLSNESTAAGNGPTVGANPTSGPGYPDFPPSPDSWLGETPAHNPPTHPHHHHPHYTT